MKSFAYTILMAIVIMIIVQPLIEVAEVCRESLMIGSAMTNAFRVARDRSLAYNLQRELDAVVELDDFSDYFAETFSEVLDLSTASIAYGTIEFNSYNDLYNDFTADIELDQETDVGGDEITTAEISISTNHKFKNKLLKLITDDYELTQKRKYVLTIKN